MRLVIFRTEEAGTNRSDMTSLLRGLVKRLPGLVGDHASAPPLPHRLSRDLEVPPSLGGEGYTRNTLFSPLLERQHVVRLDCRGLAAELLACPVIIIRKIRLVLG